MFRSTGLIVFVLVVLACVREGEPAATAEEPRPPVILIALDTLRADHLPTYGYERATAPGLAALAEDSIVFENAASQASQTLVSFKSFFSANYPNTLLEAAGHGASARAAVPRDDATDYATKALRAIRATAFLSELGRLGYRRVAFADGGWVTRSSGFAEGFNYFDSSREGLEGRIRAATGWLDRRSDDQFFLFLHAYDVHCPYSTREPFQSAYHAEHASHASIIERCFKAVLERHDWVDQDVPVLVDHYDSGIGSADDHVTRFLDWLREAELYEPALIVLFSDHGEALGERRVGGELMIGHGALYPEQLHVPLFFKMPAGQGFEPGRLDALVELVDVLPTVIDLLGGTEPQGVDGRSLMPLLRRERAVHRQSLRAELSYNALPTGNTSLGESAQWIPGREFLRRDVFSGYSEAFDLAVDPAATRGAVETLENGLVQPSKAASPLPSAEAAELSELERAQLRALGYLD